MSLREWLRWISGMEQHHSEKMAEESRRGMQQASHRLANQSANVQAAATYLKKETDVLTEIVRDMHR